MEQRLIAFWENSSPVFPKILSGEVLEFKNNGLVLIKGYQGMQFKPIIILPYDEGLKEQKGLSDLAEEYYIAKDRLDTEFKEKLGQIGIK